MTFLRDIAKIWAALVERILYILDPYKKSDEIEYLRMQIEMERNEKLRFVELFSPKSSEIEENEQSVQTPVNPYIPWRVRRAQLENEHRIQNLSKPNSEKLKDDIRNLEEELEITND